MCIGVKPTQPVSKIRISILGKCGGPPYRRRNYRFPNERKRHTMSKNKSKKKCEAMDKSQQNRPAKEDDVLSLPSGKDDSRLVTVVRERWDAYKAQEKRFSKEFALALIALHKQLAKPGYGKFVEKMKELKIPPSTAYRLMRLHGWKPEKQITKKKAATPDLDRGKAVVAAIHYLNQFAGEQFLQKFEDFLQELRMQFADKLPEAA